MLAPNVLGRHRATGEEISSTQYYRSYPWDKPEYPLERLTPHSKKKKKTNNKQETEKEHEAEGAGYTECT
jgi:hypothetical protein